VLLALIGSTGARPIPGHSGAGRSGSPTVAFCQLVPPPALPAQRQADRDLVREQTAVGGGMYRSMSCSRATQSFCSDAMIGTARARGTGVTRCTHCEASQV
jgi:hypothetical protein